MADRLPPQPAQRIDRSRPLELTFAGRRVAAFAGDTIGSALHAAGVRVLSRSFKYHRPRGLFCCAGRCPTCLVNVDGVPHVRACTEPVRPGMTVRPQHAWPSLERDVLAVFDRLHRVLPVGFYYKTFIRPRRLWPAWERVLKRLAGLGEIGEAGEPAGEYEREHVFADVAVIGGGPAGMAAALEAAEAGIGVVLVDDQPRLGGSLLARLRPPAGAEAAGLAARIAGHRRIRVLAPAMAFGLYEDGLLGVLHGRCFVRLRASQVVVAAGAAEHPLVFQNNDLPGVMLGSGAARLQALYGVRPGALAVVAASDDRGLELALGLVAGGTTVAAVIDARASDESALASELRAAGIPHVLGQTILEARGDGAVRSAVVGRVDSGLERRVIACDLICVSTALEPAAELVSQAGGGLSPRPADDRLVPSTPPPGVIVAGEAAGVSGLEAVIASGRLGGARAVLGLRVGDSRVRARVAELAEALRAEQRLAAHGSLRVAPGAGAKRFVCLCEDVTETDLRQAIAEGFDHIETLKRYTTVTMGPCQGKMCHRPSIDLCAALTGRTIAETGTTTARPPLQPVPLGALAARAEEPVKLSAMHDRHVAQGAPLTDMGGWKRPLVYSSVDEECRAVHGAVGIIDVSTLGKLDLKGADVAAFLDWLHPNRFSDLAPGRVRYRVMCDDAGIVLDDGVVARRGDDCYLLTTTTGTIDAIEQWFEWWLAGSGRCAHVTNVTAALAAVNVAGPRARELLAPLCTVDLAAEAFPYLAAREGLVAGVPSLLLRIGFVGELGYEIHFPADYGEHVWQALLDAGSSLGVRPFGVEAQRVLRLEKQLAIVGHDTDALANPLDANLGWIVKLDKPDFIGRAALREARERGGDLRLVGFQLQEGSLLPGEGAAVVLDGQPVGRVTSSKWSAHLGRAIGLAWVPVDLARDGATFEVRVDGGSCAARVVERPLHDPEGRRVRA